MPKSFFWGYLLIARAKGHSRCPPNPKMNENMFRFGDQIGSSFRKKCVRFLMDFPTPRLRRILKGLGYHLGSLLVVFSAIFVDSMKKWECGSRPGVSLVLEASGHPKTTLFCVISAPTFRATFRTHFLWIWAPIVDTRWEPSGSIFGADVQANFQKNKKNDF